ncbi:MAG: DUF357 domain-containing protein [Nanoarchaeota archaeon]
MKGQKEKGNVVTEKKLDTYFSTTEKAILFAKKAPKEKGKQKEAEVCIDMAERYFSDAKHFRSKGEYVLAYGCVNYAHGWLDCAARLGLFKVKDSSLFTVDED